MVNLFDDKELLVIETEIKTFYLRKGLGGEAWRISSYKAKVSIGFLQMN